MCPPDSTSGFAFSVPLSPARLGALALVITITAMSFPAPAIAQNSFSTETARERMHDSAQWAAIEQQLPDRVTSTPEELERQGDILRARRFPEDANDYYNFALQNGGDSAMLLDKIGLTALEMKDVPWARAYFKRVVQLNRKSADGWNNLGTVEYLNGRAAFAIADYERAVKLDKGRAVFHCNLATAYFGRGDTRDARKEIVAALKLDPQIFEREDDAAGVATHVLSAEDRARFSFEMAKLYARSGTEEEMMHSLAMSSEAGLDVRREMRRDRALVRYASDPRVVVLAHNAQALRVARGADVKATGAGTAAPPLAAMIPLEE